MQAKFPSARPQKGPPQSARGGKKAREALDLQRTKQAMLACSSPEQFAREHVWGMEAQEIDVTQAASLVHSACSDTVKSQYIMDMQDKADKAMNFWWQTYSVALHIGMVWFGVSHTSSSDTEDDRSHPINAGRTRWHLIFVAAAIELRLFGGNKYHDFITRVWNITMRDFVVHSSAWNTKTGALYNANMVKSQPENYSHFGPMQHTMETSLDKTITSVERVIAIRMRMNAQTARKTYWDSCLEWMTKTLVKGDLQFNKVRWESHEDALENILGTTATGPWRNDGAINTCGSHRVADKVVLHEAQASLLGSPEFLAFDPGEIVCVCALLCSEMCWNRVLLSMPIAH